MGAKVECLVCDLCLQPLRHVQEHLKQVSVEHFGKTIVVYLTLDVASSEQFMVTPSLSVTFAVTGDCQLLR